MRIRTLVLVVGIATSAAAQAQLSVGADLAYPTGDFGEAYSMGVGPSVGLDVNITEVFTVFGQVNYDFLFVKADFSDVITSAYMIPYQAGLKVYISGDSRGLYGMGLLGGHTVGSKITILGVETSDSNTLFSWGLGVGFRSYNVDLGLRFNSVSPDKEIDNSKASSYIALRVGFFLGGD